MTFSNPHNLPICMMKQVPLKTLKSGDTFLRKIDAQRTLKRQHYNRASVFFGPANYSCGDAYGDINYEIFLKGSTQVWVEMTEKISQSSGVNYEPGQNNAAADSSRSMHRSGFGSR